jgi:hypothetical protein
MIRSQFRVRATLAVTLGAVLIVASACGDLSTSPRGGRGTLTSPSYVPPDSAVLAAAVTRSRALRSDLTYRFTVVPDDSATVAIPGTGLTVAVPAGAVAAPVTITVTAYAGSTLAYDFQPHGTRFLRPLVLRQALATTAYARLTDPGAVEAGYFGNAAQLHPDNTACVDEFLPVRVDAAGGTAEWNVEHFSGYILSSGRRGKYTPPE